MELDNDLVVMAELLSGGVGEVAVRGVKLTELLPDVNVVALDKDLVVGPEIGLEVVAVKLADRVVDTAKLLPDGTVEIEEALLLPGKRVDRVVLPLSEAVVDLAVALAVSSISSSS